MRSSPPALRRGGRTRLSPATAGNGICPGAPALVQLRHLLVPGGREPTQGHRDPLRQFICQGSRDLASARQRDADAPLSAAVTVWQRAKGPALPLPQPPLRSTLTPTFQERDYIKHGILHGGKINTVFNSLLLNLTLGTMAPCSVPSRRATRANHLTVITHPYPDKLAGTLGGCGSDGIRRCGATGRARLLPAARRPLSPLRPPLPHRLRQHRGPAGHGREPPATRTGNPRQSHAWVSR